MLRNGYLTFVPCLATQVMEGSCLEYGMAQRNSSALVGGHDITYPIHAFIFTVLCFGSVEYLRITLASSLHEGLAWDFAAQRLPSVTRCS